MNTRQPSTLLPFARSYWVQTDHILAGFYPGDRDPAVARGKLTGLLNCGITHILNLMEPHEGDHGGRRFISYKEDFLQLAQSRRVKARWMQRPIRDLGVPTHSQMSDTLNAIDGVISAGGCVYVHCWGGKGRTGTVIGCWLARHGEHNPIQHLRQLTAHARQHFPSVPENVQQKNFVRQWRTGQ